MPRHTRGTMMRLPAEVGLGSGANEKKREEGESMPTS
jgi:hypothetical protein